MTKTAQPRTWVRAVNGLAALAVAVFVLVTYLPALKAFDVYRAELDYRGEWIEGHARRVTAVTPGGAADRAGVKPGDVLEFDPTRGDDWVLAGYRQMPEGFRGSLPVRHADGTKSVVAFVPERVALLPTTNDRAAWAVRFLTGVLLTSLTVFLVWVRPSLMTWSLFFWSGLGWPVRVIVECFLAFEATGRTQPTTYLLPVSWSLVLWAIPFAATFPRGTSIGWARWKWVGALGIVLVSEVYLCRELSLAPFERAMFPFVPSMIWCAGALSCFAVSIALLVRNHRRSDSSARARLKWAMLGMSVSLASYAVYTVQFITHVTTATSSSLTGMASGQWMFALTTLLVWPASFGYAVLRERVIDVQFAVSRTLVYGVVSTIVLVFLTVLHWLFGRVIEHSGLAFGLEGLAAVGLGLVLHRASHAINLLVDRVLFRKHHEAEERLKRVTAALPFASTEQSIAQAIVDEPVRNLRLASAALFYRDSPEGPLRRVRSEGWSDSHTSSLDPESLLVRYLQAEHQVVRLDEGQQWLPPDMPEGSAHPVLAVPIVAQHALSAVVLYGAHVNATLPDPDEVELLAALAKAAATSHQQVRIATLARENAALVQEASKLKYEAEIEKGRNDHLTALLRERIAGAPGTTT